MTIKLSDIAVHTKSQERLADLYRHECVPAEKKPFIVDLERSSGIYLAIQDDDAAILDAASQIATLGLGFNHSALFGAVQHLSSWIDDLDSPEFRGLKTAYAELLRRKLGSTQHAVAFCNSGAEAIERALAACWECRQIKSADRVLAFEGSFHGRTKFALETTWGTDKRIPFSWPEQAAVFAPYPESDSSDPASERIPAGWWATWNDQDDRRMERNLSGISLATDPLLIREIESLVVVRNALKSGQCFAILIEPMQSEGGDRYSSARFHQGLAALARAYSTPLIYDEIQTGFHLGRSFFWHQQFKLPNGVPTIIPDIVVGAKKAQVGVLLSRLPVEGSTDICAASLARGYIQASMLDQFSEEIGKIETWVATRLRQLIEDHSSLIRRPRSQGMAFAFDFATPAQLKRAIDARFEHGLLFYSAGEQTARFRLNLSFGESTIAQLFEQLDSLLSKLGGTAKALGKREFSIPNVDHHFAFHQSLIRQKLSSLRGGNPIDEAGVRTWLEEQIRAAGLLDTDVTVRLLNRESYPRYRDKILKIQVEVYEPARQTPGSDFDCVFASERPLAILVEKGDALIAMAIAGPLNQFTFVHGVATDPDRFHSDAAYMVDATVASSYRGRMGRILKQAIVLLAIANGYRTIHGRNRDRLARSMWAINLSLGSFVTQHLEDDYDDRESFRDCLYYHCPIAWDPPAIRLSRGISAPFGISDLNDAFVARNLPSSINKLTLSNFIDSNFIDDLRTAIELFPVALQHGYAASSLAEATDKAIKSIWRFRKPRTQLLTFRDHYFGDGTLLARSLSGIGELRYDVRHLIQPDNVDDPANWANLRQSLFNENVLAFLVEPLPSRTMSPLPVEVLRKLRAMCNEASVPLVYNESASMCFRYVDQCFAASGLAEIEPDAAVAGLGGQMALALVRRSLFENEPLKIISTWDGDGLSLAKFATVARGFTSNLEERKRMREEFTQLLERQLSKMSSVAYDLRFGCGWIEGNLPEELAAMLERNSQGRWLVCPSPSAMRQFIERFR